MKKLIVAVGFVGLLLVPATAGAQFWVGAQGNWADDFDFGAGVRAGYDFRHLGEPIAVMGTFDWFFPRTSVAAADLRYYEFNLNAVYVKGVNPKLDTWVGIGLNVARFERKVDDVEVSSFDRAGLNLLGGARAKFGPRFGGFFEVRYEIEGGEQIVLTGGLDYFFKKGPNN